MSSKNPWKLGSAEGSDNSLPEVRISLDERDGRTHLIFDVELPDAPVQLYRKPTKKEVQNGEFLPTDVVPSIEALCQQIGDGFRGDTVRVNGQKLFYGKREVRAKFSLYLQKG